MAEIKISKIDGSGRFRLPKSLNPGWSIGQTIGLVPLVWRRAIQIPHDYQMEAWFLIDLSKENEGAWVVSPSQVQKRSQEEKDAGDLVTAIFEIKVEEHIGGFRLTLPKSARDLGWLPTINQKIVLKPDSGGVSLWSTRTYNRLISSLSSKWENY